MPLQGRSPLDGPRRLVVVAAAIAEGGRLLAAERSGPPGLAGCWELPGGKVEAGESDTDALVRECREELGIEVTPRVRVGGDWPVTGRPLEEAVMRVWMTTIASGRPRLGDSHRELRWLAPASWLSVPWLDADLPVLDALRPMPCFAGEM